MAETLTRQVNEHVSDLFFNLDHSDAKITDPRTGQFAGWDSDKMRAQARWFYDALDNLMYNEPPSIDSILNDFYTRV